MKETQKNGAGNRHVSANPNEYENDGQVEGFAFAKFSGCSVNILPTKQKAFLEPMILALTEEEYDVKTIWLMMNLVNGIVPIAWVKKRR